MTFLPRSKCRGGKMPSQDLATPAFLIVCTFLVVYLYFYRPPELSVPPVYFISVGDFGSGSQAQKEVARQMSIQATLNRVKFVLSLGDNMYPAGVSDVEDSQFREYFEGVYTQKSLQVPWFMALGDHDNRGSVDAQVQYSQLSSKWNMSAPYYVLTVPLGASHSMDIVVTDSVRLEGAVANDDPMDRRFFEDYNFTHVGREAGKEHLRWLEFVLLNSSADWLLVVGHRPILTCAERPRFPAEKRLSDLLRPLLSKYHVDVYMNGHDHVGQHLVQDGVVFMGNGVGGYGNHPAHPNNQTVWANDKYDGFVLHRATPTELEFQFMDSNGSKLHTIRLTKPESPRDLPLKRHQLL